MRRRRWQKPKAFQSTLSARRATSEPVAIVNGRIISIHALREESDSEIDEFPIAVTNFNPRSPRGERPLRGLTRFTPLSFQSTLSARRATADLHNILSISFKLQYAKTAQFHLFPNIYLEQV